jgi:hypothetical protein
MRNKKLDLRRGCVLLIPHQAFRLHPSTALELISQLSDHRIPTWVWECMEGGSDSTRYVSTCYSTSQLGSSPTKSRGPLFTPHVHVQSGMLFLCNWPGSCIVVAPSLFCRVSSPPWLSSSFCSYYQVDSRRPEM